MAEAIYLPKVGMTMEEGTLTKWVAADGASVSRGDVLFELETEKVEMEVEAEAEGTLKQLVPEDTLLRPGDVVGCLLAAGEEVPQALVDRVAAQSGAAQATPTAQPQTPAGPAATPSGAIQRISPVARRLADESGIDVRALTGSGPDGRIVERDVQRAIEAKGSGEAQPRRTAPVAETGAASVAYHGRRRVIGDRMLESVQSMAQLTLLSETPVGETTKMLHGLNREWRSEGVVVTLTGLIVRACAVALREQPQLNSRIEDDAILMLPEINIGVAVAQDEGLIVPVVKNADKLTLKETSNAMHQQVLKARDDKLSIEDVEGGTFTITSLDGTVVDGFTPIINPPQAAILGIGRVRDVAAFEGSDVVKRQVTTLSLTFDHRVVDGAPASRFLGRLAELLERPYLLM